MEKISVSRQAAVATAIRSLAVFNAVTFLLGAALHLGAEIPLGFAVAAEPRIVGAAVVEGLIGLLFLIAAYALFSRSTWARTAVVTANIFGLVGVLFGTFALAVGLGPRTLTNDIYHYVWLSLLAAGLILLMTPNTKIALER